MEMTQNNKTKRRTFTQSQWKVIEDGVRLLLAERTKEYHEKPSIELANKMSEVVLVLDLLLK